MPRIVHFEIANNSQENDVKIVQLQNAGVSLINYGNLNIFSWNESFDRLADYLESEMNWSNYLNEYN